MRYENKTEPRVAKPEPTVPQEEGFYWAKWRMPDDEDDKEFVFVDKWEVVEVHATLGETDDDFRVSLTGYAKTQSVENFAWAKPVRPISPPTL